MDKICGVSLAKNVIKYDYCAVECIQSMLACCDYVVVAYVESEDNTLEILESIKADNYKIIKLTEEDWNFYDGKERLAYITNAAISEADRLGFSYVLNIQMDELIHEDCYDAIRQAVQEGHESVMCKRINLWGNPYHYLDVEQHRKPCSTEILRLAKISCRSYGDAESLMAHTCTFDWVEKIRIYHMGFVRKREVMKSKIINMQCAVFGMGNYDNKLDQEEQFNPNLWFNPETDLKPITERLPKLIEKWAEERAKDY